VIIIAGNASSARKVASGPTRETMPK